MGRVGSVLKIVGINLLVLLIALVIVELIFGSWFQNVHALHQFTKPRNLSIVNKNPIGGQPERIRYTRDANGFRGQKPRDHVRETVPPDAHDVRARVRELGGDAISLQPDVALGRR